MKKILSAALALAMCLSLLPAAERLLWQTAQAGLSRPFGPIHLRSCQPQAD